MPEDTRLDFTELKERYEASKILFQQKTAKLSTIAAYCRPRDQDYFLDNDDKSDNPQGSLFSYAAANQLIALTNKTILTLIPTNANWFSIGLSDDIMLDENLDEDVKIATNLQLAKITSKILHVFNNSNFRIAFEEWVLNFFTFGYALMKITPDAYLKEVEFDSISNDSFYMEQSPSSKKVSIFIRRKWRVRDWNRENPTKMIEDTDKKSEVFVVTGRVYLGVKKEVKVVDGAEVDVYIPRIAEVVFLEKGQSYLSYNERKTDTGQLVLGRMKPSTGDTYPDGFGSRLLPEAQTINQLTEAGLEIAEWQGHPMFEVSQDADLPNNFAPLSGGILRTDSDTFRNGGGIRPLDIGGNPGVVLQATNDALARLGDSMRLVPATSDVPQFRTATEWAIQEGREKESVGPAIDLAKQELLIPMLKHVIEFLQDMGHIDETVNVKGSAYTLRVSGAEEERDKRSKLLKLEALEERTNVMMQTNPTAIHANIDDDKKIAMIVESLGLQQIMRSPEDKAKIEEQVLQAQQQAQEQQTEQPPQ